MWRLAFIIVAVVLSGCGKAPVSVNSQSASYAIETTKLSLSDLERVWQGDQGLCEIDLRGVIAGQATHVPVNAVYVIQSKTNPNDTKTQCGAFQTASVLAQDNGDGTLSVSIGLGPAPTLSIPDGYKLVSIGGAFGAAQSFTLSGNPSSMLWTTPASHYETLSFLFQAE